jgi:hypothetical protein
MAGAGKPGRKMKPRGNCLICGTSLEGKRTDTETKYCSRRCAGEAHRRKTVYHCKQCGAEFVPKAPDRTTFCSRECAFAYKREHSKPPEPERPALLCEMCGKVLTGFQVKACSEECRTEMVSRRGRERGAAAHVATPHICAECGDTFIPAYGNHHRRFCSDQCMRRNGRRVARALRRAREKGVRHQPVDPRRIYDRDGWRCGICGKQVERALRYPDPQSASLDHVIPLACGGAHSPENVQCAHLSCNHDKGAGRIAEMRLAPSGMGVVPLRSL